MTLHEWIKKNPKPKRADLKLQLALWIEAALPTDERLARMTVQDHAAWQSALDQVQSIFQRAADGDQDESSKAPAIAAAGLSANRLSFVGQSELGPQELAEHVPDFPYWEEMLRLGKKRLPSLRHVPERGTLSIDRISASDFSRGVAGSAFAGLIQIAARTAEATDRLFLVPLFQEDSELRTVKFQRRKASYRTAGGKLLSPHASALQALIKERKLERKPWAGFDPDELRAEESQHEAGCFLGFFLVKGESNEAGTAYLNFTCASLNRYATGMYNETPQLDQPGGPELPLSFAKRVCSLLSKLS